MTQNSFKKAILLLAALFFNTLSISYAQNWNHYKGNVTDIEFDYPYGWTTGVADNDKYRFTENMYMQPTGQDFNARSGEVVIRIFDPMAVAEDAKSNPAFSLSLFNSFVTTISDGQSFTARSIFNGGHQYFVCDEKGPGYVTRIIGMKSPNNNMYVIAMACAPYVNTANESILYHVAESLQGAEPKPALTPAEAVLKRWYTDLSISNVTDMDAITCNSLRGGNWLAALAVKMFGASGGATTGMAGLQAFDYSHLRYYTVAKNSSLAVVRVCGNIINPYKQPVPFYQYARIAGNSNLFVIRLENGDWKVCENHHK